MYIVNSCVFYFYKIIGKLTVSLKFCKFQEFSLCFLVWKDEVGELFLFVESRVWERMPKKKTVQWCFEHDNTSTVVMKEEEILRRISWCECSWVRSDWVWWGWYSQWWDSEVVKSFRRSPGECQCFVSTDDGILNEFEKMCQIRILFPLHFLVFRQTSCHLTTETNVEKNFSRRDVGGWMRNELCERETSLSFIKITQSLIY